MCVWLHVPHFTKIPYILTFPPASSEQFLRAFWHAVSRDTVLILPQIKLNSQLSRCTFSSVDKSFCWDVHWNRPIRLCWLLLEAAEMPHSLPGAVVWLLPAPSPHLLLLTEGDLWLLLWGFSLVSFPQNCAKAQPPLGRLLKHLSPRFSSLTKREYYIETTREAKAFLRKSFYSVSVPIVQLIFENALSFKCGYSQIHLYFSQLLSPEI